MRHSKIKFTPSNIVKRKDVQRVIFLTKSATQQHVWPSSGKSFLFLWRVYQGQILSTWGSRSEKLWMIGKVPRSALHRIQYICNVCQVSRSASNICMCIKSSIWRSGTFPWFDSMTMIMMHGHPRYFKGKVKGYQLPRTLFSSDSKVTGRPVGSRSFQRPFTPMSWFKPHTTWI